jgi:NADPH2 dehydrogenase
LESGLYFLTSDDYKVLLFTTLAKITDSVHANDCYMFLQLWAPGRTADPDVLKQEGGFDLVAPSPIPFNGNIPHELTILEIKDYVRLYSKAASNAIMAGFDGVELHAANGCLLDQFLQTVSNERTDEYGGSVDNRVRFPLEVLKAVVEAVGAERTAVRIGPWTTFQGEKRLGPLVVSLAPICFIGMGMKDPVPTFTTFVERIRDEHPSLAYIHAIEARVHNFTVEAVTDENRTQSNEVFRKIWGNRPYIAAGGMDRAKASDTVEKHGGLIAFGRHFVSNVSLVFYG